MRDQKPPQPFHIVVATRAFFSRNSSVVDYIEVIDQAGYNRYWPLQFPFPVIAFRFLWFFLLCEQAFVQSSLLC